MFLHVWRGFCINISGWRSPISNEFFQNQPPPWGNISFCHSCLFCKYILQIFAKQRDIRSKETLQDLCFVKRVPKSLTLVLYLFQGVCLASGRCSCKRKLEEEGDSANATYTLLFPWLYSLLFIRTFVWNSSPLAFGQAGEATLPLCLK